MKAFVDSEKCLSCGVCEGDCPEVFTLEGSDVAKVLLDPIPEKFWKAVRQAVDDCPEIAITIED